MTSDANKGKGKGKGMGKSILRTNPRYSGNDTNAATASAHDPSPIVIRSSLADLVQSSAALSAEAAQITNDDVGRVLSHHEVSSNSNASDTNENAINNTVANNNSTVSEQEEKTIMEKIPLLQISESGSPYLQTTAVVDANGDIAFGIVGDDGEHVRFCEHNYGDDGKKNDKHISSRKRIQNRMYVHHAEDVFESDECNIPDSESDATDDDAILSELGMSELIPSEHDSDDETEEESTIPIHANNTGEMRAFLLIWQTLTKWVTPETTALLQGQNFEEKDTTPQYTATEESPSTSVRRSVEIGASRRSGIMSMMRMYFARSISELKRLPQQTQQQKDILNDSRVIEQRLGDLVRTFDVNGSVAKFNAKQWKLMTTILIVISFPELTSQEKDLPKSAQSLNMTPEEYQYLTRSALSSLSNDL